MWQQVDDNSDRKLTQQEFIKMTVDHNFSITKDEANQLFRELDVDNSGSIDFDEFLAKLTPPLNNTRMNLINMAFTKLDKTNDKKVYYIFNQKSFYFKQI